MWYQAVEIDPFILWYARDNLKMQAMCIRTVEAGFGLLEYVPDWFVTQGMMIIGMMMTNLLSGMKVIKNGRPRKQRLRKNSSLLLGIPIV